MELIENHRSIDVTKLEAIFLEILNTNVLPVYLSVLNSKTYQLLYWP